MQKYLNYVATVLLSIVFCAVAASAQVTGGAITGSVVDANGAVVPNVEVRITDKARGSVFTAQTTGSGSYNFVNVPTGEYTISIEGTGFATVSRDLSVTLNQTNTVDVVLQVAGGTTVVDVVAGGASIVQTDSSQVGTTFSGRSAQDLPVGSANGLALLAPNVIPPANGTAGSGGVSGGVRARGNSFNIDGVDNNDASVTGPSTGPIQDAVSEFTLLQNNFNAEFGAGAGGQFNTITKSGTNQFRGNIFTYIGSEQFNAPSTDESSQGFKNFFKEVRYGGTFGGPLPFPNFGEGGPVFRSGKNKLFFFGAYEKYFQTGESAAGSFFAPTLAGLNQLAAIPGVSPFVIDIFRNNVSLATTGTAAATASFGNILGRTGIEFGEVILPIPAFQEQKSYQFNVDHLPSQRDQFRYRFARTRYLAEQAGSGGLAFNNNVTYDTDLFSINYIRTFSSNLINDLRLSYLGTKQDFPLKNPALSNFPNIIIDSLNLEIGPGGNLPQSGYDFNYQVYDSITLVTGQHTFKFGGDYRRYLGGSNFLARSRGEYRYSTFDILLQDFIPDAVNLRGIGSGSGVFNNQRIFVFGQDDWKVRPNLTLNLGLRYEYQGLYRDAALQATAAPASIPGVIEFGVPQVDKNNFAPRLGLAYAPHWDNMIGNLLFGEQRQSSIRVNFSRAFFSNFSNFVIISLPPTSQGLLENAGSATNFLANGGAGTAPFVPNLSPTFLRANSGNFILDQIVPYTDSFAVSYQRELGAGTGLELRYLRTRSKDLPVQVQLNSRPVIDAAFVIPTFLGPPTASQLAGLPTIANVVTANSASNISPTSFLAPRQLAAQGFPLSLTGFPNIGESRYDGVAASVTRRFTSNVGFTAAYTFSKTEDNSTNELFTSSLNPRRAQDAGEFFGEGLNIDNDFSRSVLDIPHRFVTSFSVDIPFSSSNAFLKAVLGGFQINGIFQIQSGQPITVQAGRDANLNGDSAGDRAIFNPNGDRNISSGIYAVNSAGVRIQRESKPGSGIFVDVLNSPTTVGYVAINPNAGFISTGFFARELVGGGIGLAGRNSFRTRGFNNTDLILLKNTRFGPDGRFNFQIGAEIFDVFNQRQKTINGVGAYTAAFATAGNANFNNYDIGSFGGRSITLRGKFFF
ncbi:MAG: TonB-dependent receptor [Acidobacteriota bacterium]|nr:TonB-dependent receptor [Acidobacteriota bacterium]